MKKTTLERLLGPLLPSGLSFADLAQPVAAPRLEEAGPLKRILAGKRTLPSKGYDPTVLAAGQEERLAKQDELKSRLAQSIGFLLDGAERNGRRSAAKLRRGFLAAVQDAYAEAFRNGVSATADDEALDDEAVAAAIADEVEREQQYFGRWLEQIFDDEETMDRDRRVDLYGQALDGIFGLGAVAGTPGDTLIWWKLTPAEHCRDCIALAARSPFVKPGSRHPDYDALPTVPRRGDTDCMRNCRCYLEYAAPETAPPRRARRKVGYEQPPAKEPTKPAGKPTKADDDLQARVDDLGARMLWAKAQYHLTGDQRYLGQRRDLNGELIALQDRTGLKFRPRTTSDASIRVLDTARENGYTAVRPGQFRVPAKGAWAAVVQGIDFQTGKLTAWDQTTGRGTLTTADGRKIPVAVDDTQYSHLMLPRAKKFIDRAWEIPTRTGAPFVQQMPGKQSSLASLAGLFEGRQLWEATEPTGLPLVMSVFAEYLDARPAEEWHGVQLAVQPEGRLGAFEQDGIVTLVGLPTERAALRRAVYEALGLYVWRVRAGAPAAAADWPAGTLGVDGPAGAFAAAYAATLLDRPEPPYGPVLRTFLA